MKSEYSPADDLQRLALEFEELKSSEKIKDLPIPAIEMEIIGTNISVDEVKEIYEYIVQRYIATGAVPAIKEITLRYLITKGKCVKALETLIRWGWIGKTPLGYLSITGETDQLFAERILKRVTEEFLVEIDGLSGEAKEVIRSLIIFASKSKWVLTGEK